MYRQQRASRTFVKQSTEFQKLFALPVHTPYEHGNGKGKPYPATALWRCSVRPGEVLPLHTQS
jgi:hypothetical protein